MVLIHYTERQTNQQLLLDHAQRFGDTPLAYTALQSGLSYFVHDGGFIAYAEVGEHCLVLGDPLAEHNSWKGLVDQFLLSNRNAAFFQVGEEMAGILHQRGFHISHFGYESNIRLPFSLNGKYRSDARRMVNRARAAGVEVLELNASERRSLGIADEAIQDLSRRWMNTKIVQDRELQFLCRPLLSDEEPAVRKLYALRGGKLCGLAVYDPMFRDNDVVGYSESNVRTEPDAPKGTRDLLLTTALQRFSDEGHEICSLGLTPLAPLPDEVASRVNLQISKIPNAALRLAYHLLNGRAFNFKGTQFKKSRYTKPHGGGNSMLRPVFLASRRRNSLVDAYYLAQAMGVSPWRQLLRVHK